MVRQILKALALFAPLLLAGDDPKDSGPLTLIVQYKCSPGSRAELRKRLSTTDIPALANLQAKGQLAGYRVLFSRYVDSNAWDALTILSFRGYSDVAKWRKVEESAPAGLTPGSLALTSSIETYPVDLLRHESTGKLSADPVYLVVPYSISIPAPEYLKYFDDYVGPQFKGWIQEGVLNSYQLLLQRYTAARPWDTMIILQYKDDDSFGLREKIVAKVRAQLQSNPVWKAASDSKRNLRTEKEAIIADQLGASR